MCACIASQQMIGPACIAKGQMMVCACNVHHLRPWKGDADKYSPWSASSSHVSLIFKGHFTDAAHVIAHMSKTRDCNKCASCKL